MNKQTDTLVILDKIPVVLDFNAVAEKVRLRPGNERLKNVLTKMIETVTTLAKPKAMFKISRVLIQPDDIVVIEGVKLANHVLRVGFEKVETVYPFVSTCGEEVNSIDTPEEALSAYYLDSLKRMVLGCATKYLEARLKELSGFEVSRFSPGDLPGWDISHQPELFAIIGDVEKGIGVKLTGSSMMSPEKSVSGIFFPTAQKFEACALCTRKCTERKAPYDINLAKRLEVVR